MISGLISLINMALTSLILSYLTVAEVSNRYKGLSINRDELSLYFLVSDRSIDLIWGLWLVKKDERFSPTACANNVGA